MAGFEVQIPICVCVGFLYTETDIPSPLGLGNMSKKGMPPSSFGCSMVNLMCGLMEFRYWSIVSLSLSFPVFDWERELRTQCKVFKILHVNVGNYWRAGGTHGGTVKLFKELVLEGKDTVLQD